MPQEEVERMIERRVHDFRLDSRLRKSCEEDIYTMCSFSGVSFACVLPVGHWHSCLRKSCEGNIFTMCSFSGAGSA